MARGIEIIAFQDGRGSLEICIYKNERERERHGRWLAHCTFKCAFILIHTVFQNVLLSSLSLSFSLSKNWTADVEVSRRRGRRSALFHRGDTYFLISRVIAAERAAVNCIWELRARTHLLLLLPSPPLHRKGGKKTAGQF